MARIAAGSERSRPVRQSRMAALARVVTADRNHERYLLCVTAVASRLFGQGEHEIVGLVALLACSAAVEILVGSGDLVTAAAVAHAHIEACARGMRIVAPDAGSGDAAARVVGVLVLVATGAGALRRATHVVR